MTDTDRIAEIRARAEAATPGPWENASGEFVTYKTPIGEMTICRANKPVGVRWAPDGTGRTYDCGAGSEQPNKEFIAHAREDIPYLLERLEEAEREPPAYKFYYCESEDSYLLGRRMDNFYYAHWYEGLGFVWDMSRYLPWGETVDGREHGCMWGIYTYPSEPKEIGASEWFVGFLMQRGTLLHTEPMPEALEED